MSYKILLVGKNTTIIDTFFNHLDHAFDCMTSSMRFDDLKNHIQIFQPDALVCCLNNETPEEFKRIATIIERYGKYHFGLVIIGSKEDCADFQDVTISLAQLEILKPTSPTKIEGMLNSFLKSRPAPDYNPDDKSSNTQTTSDNSKSKPVPPEYKLFTDDTENSTLMNILDGMDTPSVNPSELESDLLASLKGYSTAQSNVDAFITDAADTTPEPSQRKHILVIDDDPLMLKVMKDYLHDQYDVATAKGGKIAYKFLEKKHTDMILLDYEMPEENGPAVYQNIRQMPGMENVPILFLTGVADKERVMNVVSLKPQGYLVKPINYDTLISTITPLLS